jgi:FkbM family methyltransferase
MQRLLSVPGRFKAYIKFVKNWWDVVLDRYGMKNGEYVIHLRNGIDCLARGGQKDYTVIFEVVARNPYFPKIDGFDIHQGDTVLDIGANSGIFSLLAAQKGATVFAYEPSLGNFTMLTRNAALNKGLSGSVMPIKKAVSDKEATIKLFLGTHNTIHSIFQEFHGKLESDAHTQEEVQCTTLDNLVAERSLSSIDFLKMDCEGAEYPILFGASKKTLSLIKRISMEYHEFDKRTGAELAAYLRENGFQVKEEPNIPGFGYIFAWR